MPVALKTHKTLTETVAWAASADRQITLPNDGVITRVVLHYSLTATNILAADTNTEFAQWKAIQNLKIEGAIANYVNAVGDQMGRMLHFLNQRDFPGRVFNRAMATSTIYGSIILHFGSRPRDQYGRDNPYDLSAFIPAKDEGANSLKLTVTCPAASDIVDTTVDISAGTYWAEVYRVLNVPSRGMIPRSESDQYGHTGNLTDHGRDVPSKGFLKRTAILSQDDTTIANGGPLVAADELTRVSFIYGGNVKLIDSIWDVAVSEQGIPREAAITAAGAVTKPSDQLVAGFAVLDYRQMEHPDYGLDLSKVDTKQIKVGLTTQNYAAGDDTILYHETYQPHVGKD